MATKYEQLLEEAAKAAKVTGTQEGYVPGNIGAGSVGAEAGRGGPFDSPALAQGDRTAFDRDAVYKQLLQSVANPAPYTYDRESDPSWSALKKTYLREGQRAAEDTLAKVSAATGGRPSSYAQNVAQQADNYYRAQLTDRLPELEERAYERYRQELAQKYDRLSALLGDREQENNEAQQKFSNALALYQTLGYATPEVAEVLGIQATEPQTGYTPAVREEEKTGVQKVLPSLRNNSVAQAYWQEQVGKLFGQDPTRENSTGILDRLSYLWNGLAHNNNQTGGGPKTAADVKITDQDSWEREYKSGNTTPTGNEYSDYVESAIRNAINNGLPAKEAKKLIYKYGLA